MTCCMENILNFLSIPMTSKLLIKFALTQVFWVARVLRPKGKHCGWYTFAQVFFLFTLDARFLGFEHIKELYKDDSDFSNVYNACET